MGLAMELCVPLLGAILLRRLQTYPAAWLWLEGLNIFFPKSSGGVPTRDEFSKLSRRERKQLARRPVEVRGGTLIVQQLTRSAVSYLYRDGQHTFGNAFEALVRAERSRSCGTEEVLLRPADSAQPVCTLHHCAAGCLGDSGAACRGGAPHAGAAHRRRPGEPLWRGRCPSADIPRSTATTARKKQLVAPQASTPWDRPSPKDGAAWLEHFAL
jgi:hypothetical protein